jgi:hypothetical protein
MGALPGLAWHGPPLQGARHGGTLPGHTPVALGSERQEEEEGSGKISVWSLRGTKSTRQSREFNCVGDGSRDGMRGLFSIARRFPDWLKGIGLGHETI